MEDYDNDGFLDIYVTNSHILLGPGKLYRNTGNDNNWLEIDLIGTISNRDGIGSRILITAGDETQLREQSGGTHYRAQNSQRIHVGLGNNTIVQSIIVFWPSGIVHEIENVTVNQILQVVEPLTPINPWKQVSLGMEPSRVICKEELTLIFKAINGNPACVKESTFQNLLKRGWAKE